MNKNTNIKIKYNCCFYIALVFAILQEGFSVLSTVSFAMLGGMQVFNLTHFLIWFSVAIGSLVICYIPSIFKSYFYQKALWQFCHKWIFRFSELFYMNPQLLGDTNFQNKKSVFANQAISNAVSMCDNTINVITLMVSFIANTIVFCFFIDPIYLIAIIIVIIAAAYQIKFSVKKRRDINLKLQRIDADVHGSLLSGWTTAIIGNRLNYNRWKADWTTNVLNAKKTSAKSVIFFGELSLLSVFCTLLPLIVVDVLSMYLHGWNSVIVWTICLTFMQQYSFVGTISGIIDAFLERYIISTKITDITNRLYVNPKDSSYTKHIVWGQVNLYKDYRDDTNGIPIKSLNNLHKITNNFQPGLYTIRGPNGSGKSLLFANIKKKYGDNVFLFPAKQDLFFKHYKNNKFSTGEALMSNIEYVLQTKNLDKNKIVLLDEWDANLDNKNADIIHKKLESIKNKICILQIRHRVDKSPTSLNNMKGGK